MYTEEWMESRFNSFKLEFNDHNIQRKSLGKNTYSIQDINFIFVPSKCALTIATEGYNGHVYVSGGGHNHAEDYMIANCVNLPDEFYLTSAPYPDCAMKLYKKYMAQKKTPTIHIALPYQGKGKKGSEGNKKTNLHCLAMLMDAGFNIVPWNWETFNTIYITNDECKQAINEMTGDNVKYKKRYDKTKKARNIAADDMVGHPDNHAICKKAASTCKSCLAR